MGGGGYLVLLVALAGCQQEPQQQRGPSQQPEPVGWSVGRLSGEVLQDLREDGSRMFATVQAVPPNSDAPRSLIVRWLEAAGGPAKWSFSDQPVLDARLVPRAGGALVITQARTLTWLSSQESKPRELDSQVVAPLSLSADGRFVAYARGEIPDLEIVRFDLEHQAVDSVTQGMAPAWSPALSEDGSRLIFVSGVRGYPDFWEMRQDQVVRLSDRQVNPVPFPSGPSAPILTESTLTFEDAERIHVVALKPLRLLRSVRGTLPVAAPRRDALLLQDPAGADARWEPVQ